MYEFSTDYVELFRLICEGHIAVGFVDYRFDRGNPDEIMRDVVQVQRYGEFQIFIGARGIAYASIYPFMREEGRTEKDLFVAYCKAVNLAFVPAQATA